MSQTDEYGNATDFSPQDSGDWFAQNAPPPASADLSTAAGAAANPQASNDAMNAQARQDPSFNPRDAIVARDSGSWAQQLKDPGDLADVQRNMSYAQNAGQGAQQFIDAKNAQFAARQINVPGGGGDNTGGVRNGSIGSGGGGVSGAPDYIHGFDEQFHAPTEAEAQASPGFQFRLGNAMKAIERSGLAKGTYFTNQTAGALTEQAGNQASAEYDKVYGRANDAFMQRFGINRANENDRFSSQRANRTDNFNEMDTNRKFDFGVSDSNRNFDRAMGNDQWGRGQDVWSMDRTNQLDYANGNVSLGDMRLRYQPKPAGG